MTNPFEMAMDAALDDLTEIFARSLQWSRDGGTAVALTGTLHEDPPDLAAREDGRNIVRTASATITASDLSVAPQIGDTISDGGVEWSVAAVRPMAGGAKLDLKLTRHEPFEKARQDYRIKK